MASRTKLLKDHQTTLRFTAEMWEQLESAADALDVSVAQYVRDAARGRLEHDASGREPAGEETASQERTREDAANARDASLAEAESTAAVWEQGRLARERAKTVREEARRLREPAVRRGVRPPLIPVIGPWEAGRVARERLNLAPQQEPRKPGSR